MWKLLFINLFFISNFCLGQTPRPQFNHAFLILDSSDYYALINSPFIKNEFSSFTTRSTTTNSNSWSGAYLHGDINYLEFFGPSPGGNDIGKTAFALGTDRVGDLAKVQEALSKSYKISSDEQKRKINDSLVPWFYTIYLDDSVFFSSSNIEFWMMEYKTEYFLFNRWDNKADSVSRETYLLQYEEKRKDKYLKRFTGIDFYATRKEADFFGKLLLKCGFNKAGSKSYISSEGFVIRFEEKSNHKYGIKKVLFETAKPGFRQEKISDHIEVILQGRKGAIQFD